MSIAAAVVVLAFGLALIAFTSVAFAKPAIAERRLYAVGSFALGALLLYGVFAGGGAA